MEGVYNSVDVGFFNWKLFLQKFMTSHFFTKIELPKKNNFIYIKFGI